MTEYRITQRLANPDRNYLVGPVVASSPSEALLRLLVSHPTIVAPPCIIEVQDASGRVCARVTAELLEQPDALEQTKGTKE